ncbi:unnamed protein product, partial [Mesorhabditis spiculigera]
MTNDELFLLDLYNHQEYAFTFERPEFLYSDAEIFALEFLENGHLLAVLQTPLNGELLLCELELDRIKRKTNIVDKVLETKMKIEPHRRLLAINDDQGLLLVSFPIKINKSQDFHIELLHCTRYIKDKTGGKLSIPVKYNAPREMVLHHAAVARNHLYLFDSLDVKMCICFPITGAQIGRANTLMAHGDCPPNSSIMTSVFRAIEDVVLVYVCQDVSNANAQPQLYALDLMRLSFQRVALQLSNHQIRGKVCICVGGNETIYLQGDCLDRQCPNRLHFYRIDLLPLMNLPKMISTETSSTPSSGTSCSSSAYSINSIGSSASSVVPTIPSRYEKRRGRAAEKKITVNDERPNEIVGFIVGVIVGE